MELYHQVVQKIYDIDYKIIEYLYQMADKLTLGFALACKLWEKSIQWKGKNQNRR